MKLVHLTVVMLIAALVVVVPQGVVGQETAASKMGADCSLTCRKPMETCNKNTGCPTVCGNQHCKDCSNRDCLVGRYGYGQTAICKNARPGETCPIHGYGPCPKEQFNLGLGLRQAFAQPNRPPHPYFGMQPLVQPRPLFPARQMPHYGGPHGGMYPPPPPGMYAPGMSPPGMSPPPQPRFPVLHSFVNPTPHYMTTAPQPPMPTYTTRGPRDFLNPNPPSIGY